MIFCLLANLKASTMIMAVTPLEYAAISKSVSVFIAMSNHTRSFLIEKHFCLICALTSKYQKLGRWEGSCAAGMKSDGNSKVFQRLCFGRFIINIRDNYTYEKSIFARAKGRFRSLK